MVAPDRHDRFTINVRWALIPNAGELDEAQLEAASDAVGAFRFARPEDGAFNLENRNQFLFVTTGGAAGANELGRLYSLKLSPYSPTRPGKPRGRVQRRRDRPSWR